MEEEFKIEDGLEVPERVSGGPGHYNVFRQTLRKLNVGQSFLVSVGRYKIDALKSTISREQKYSGKEFVSRTQTNGYIRVWRSK